MNFEDTRNLIVDHNYDVRAIIESLSISRRSLFMVNAFGLLDYSQDPPEVINCKRRISDGLSASKFKESFNFHLPHILWMDIMSDHCYYGLSDLFNVMSEHDIISPYNQEPLTIPLSSNPLDHLKYFYDHAKGDYNIVWALENIEKSKQVTFVEEVLTLAREDETSNYLNLQYTLKHQLPHIVHMLQKEGQLYEGLGSIAHAMRDHNMIYCP